MPIAGNSNGLLVMHGKEILIYIKDISQYSMLMSFEIDAVLDWYAEHYDIPRKDLKGIPVTAVEYKGAKSE